MSEPKKEPAFSPGDCGCRRVLGLPLPCERHADLAEQAMRAYLDRKVEPVSRPRAMRALPRPRGRRGHR